MKRLFTVLVAAGILIPSLVSFTIVGDINGDDKVDLSEAICALRVRAGLNPYPFPTVTSADDRVWMASNFVASRVPDSSGLGANRSARIDFSIFKEQWLPF